MLPNTQENLVRCGNGHMDFSYLLEEAWSPDKRVIKPTQTSQELSREEETLQGGGDT